MTKTIQSINAGLCGLLGLLFSFLPQEILQTLGSEGIQTTMFLIKVIGAFYLSWAILNYMIRDITLGGIYGRPIIISNLAHYGVCAVLLIKELPVSIGLKPYLFIGIAVNCTMSVAYLRILKFDPTQKHAV